MRCLAELLCEKCGAKFYSDLPSGQGLFTPMLLEQKTGVVHDRFATDWFAIWLRDSFAKRTNRPVGFSVRGSGAAKKPGGILLNCLDTLYGHSLLKLLNAQAYLDSNPELDLLLIVPAQLAWMVPDETHEAWVIDSSLDRGTEWNDWLAAEIRRRVESYDRCFLSLAFSHPSGCDFSIERFTRTTPFPLEEWKERLARPTVTFIWRDDRPWNQRQKRSVVELAEALRRVHPKLDFAVVGLGAAGDFPSWIADDRAPKIDVETERRWCARYAESHVVTGVHGSNMLLPSAHAGATVELLPPDRLGNVLQDLVIPCDDGDLRATMFRRRLLPLATAPEELAQTIDSVLRLDPAMRLLMTRDFCRHGLTSDTSRWRFPERSSER